MSAHACPSCVASVTVRDDGVMISDVGRFNPASCACGWRGRVPDTSKRGLTIARNAPCLACGSAREDIGDNREQFGTKYRATCSCGWCGYERIAHDVPPPAKASERPSVDSLIAEAMKRPAPEGVIVEVVGCVE